MEPLDYLKNANNDWFIGHDNHKFSQLAEQLYLELIQLVEQGTPPKIILAQSDPVHFLAGFIAACAASCPVFLCNPNWVKQEWQQVFELVQPDIIWSDRPEIKQQEGAEGQRGRGENPVQNLKSKIQNRIMIPTGGSSGTIRFAIHTWETLIASVQGFQQYFQQRQINSFCVLPLYHVSGLMQFLRSFITNGKFVNLPFKTIERSAPNIAPTEFFISLVPTQLQRLLQNPTSANWLSQFETVLLGGAPAWDELLEQARNYGIRLAPTYGMTETASQIVTLKPEDFLKGYNNCGKVLPHAHINIISPTNQILGTNQTGIVTIEAKSLALGYYPNLFTQKQFKVDDLGFFDEKGYLNIIGRQSNKIITGGENVYPNEVEAAIRATNLVDDVCVIGISDRTWGQVVTAIYVPNHISVNSAAIQAAIADKLTKFKQPKHWIALENLPRNSQGKINHEQLHKIAKIYST
jgi:O-succinylbenzoic acid--CoA ligase